MKPLLQKLLDGHKVGLHERLPIVPDLTRWFAWERRRCVGVGRFDGRRGNGKQVLDLFTKYLHHRNIAVIYLSVSRHVSVRKICEDHQSSTLHRGHQEPSREIGSEEFTVTSVPQSVERRVGCLWWGDASSVWVHHGKFTSSVGRPLACVCRSA